MRALVIGGSGVLGAAVLRELQAGGHTCAGTSSSPDARGMLHLDLREAAQVGSFFSSQMFDVVLNAAATGVIRGSATLQEMTLVNDRGAGTVAEVLARLPQPPRLVHLASATEPRAGGAAESPYAESKAAGCARVREVAGTHMSPVIIARVHNVYSAQRVPGRFISDALDAALQERELVLEYPDRVRDFCLLDDVAACVAELALGEPPPTREVEIGTACGVSIHDAAREVYSATGRSPALVRRATKGAEDPHPVEVADPQRPGFIRCRTLLAEGLEQVVRRRA